MADVPITIYSRRVIPKDVALQLQKLAPNLQIDGTPDSWSTIRIETQPKSFLKSAKVLELSHDEDYYDGPGWPQQQMGMANYFSSFPNSPFQKELIQRVFSFRFSISAKGEGLSVDKLDRRMELILSICQQLDGILFLPWTVRDARGRILLDQHLRPHADAVLPAMPPRSEHEESEDDDDEAVEPPSAERVARRLLSLLAVAARATMELDFKQGAEGLQEYLTKLVPWIEASGFRDELEPQEWKVIQRPLGRLENQDFIDAMWRVEGLAVLAWAMKLCPLPPYDEIVVPVELYKAIGFLDNEKCQTLIKAPQLRSKEELEDMRKHLLAFHWRVREFSLRPNAVDFVDFSKECWFGGFDVQQFRIIDGDMALGDHAIVDASEEQLGIAQSTANERHMAINWLSGLSRKGLYSQADQST